MTAAAQPAPAAPPPPASSPSGAPSLTASVGASTAPASIAASSEAQDPHIVTARRILDGLVSGAERSPFPRGPVTWAVAVIEAAGVQHIRVASSVGGGAYLPAGVYLPVGVRLATHDEMLPVGWAGDWFLGWPRPTSVIDAHHEQITEAPVYSPRLLAVVTTEMWPKRPRHGGAWLPVDSREILSRPRRSAAPGHRAPSPPGRHRPADWPAGSTT